MDKKPSSRCRYIKSNWSKLTSIGLALIGIVSQYHSARTFGLESLILSVLALIAFSQLENERKVEDLLDSYQALNTSAERYLEKSICSEHLDRIRKAKRIDLMGISFKDNLEKWFFILEERIQNGARIRILMIDTGDRNCLSSMSKRNGESVDMLVANYQFSLDRIRNISSASRKGGSIELKLVKYPPSFGLILLDQNKLGGWGEVKIYAHDGVLDGVLPHFELYKVRDEWWFGYFNHQFHNLWLSKESRPVSLC